MSDTDLEPEYPPLLQNLFAVHSIPVEYQEVPEPSTTLLGSLPPSPHPEVTMAPVGATSSGKNPMFSFSTRVDKKTPINVKLDSIGKFTG